MPESPNFSFLATDNPQLAELASLAEDYLFSRLDANTCLLKLRQFGELLARNIAKKVGQYKDDKEEQYYLLKKLKASGVLTIRAWTLFEEIRVRGNEAAHKMNGTFEVAEETLKFASELAGWYYRSFVDKFSSIPTAFVAPKQQFSPDADPLDLLEIMSPNVVGEGAIEGYKSINQKLHTLTDSVINISKLIGGNHQQRFTLDSGEVITKGIGLVSEAEVLKHQGEALQKGIFKLTVMGEFKHGKSTLLNAMLGSKKLPAKSWPVTGVITELVYGNKDEVAIYETDKEKPRLVSWNYFVENFQLQIEDQKTLFCKETIDRFKKIKYAEIQQPHFLSQSGVRLIDSPGLAENITRVRLETEFLKQSQGVIFILNALQPLSPDEREFIENNFSPGNCNHVFFVINKINLVAKEEVEESKRLFKNYLKGLYLDSKGKVDEEMCDRRVFFVNARGALNARLQIPHNQQALEESGIRALEEELERFFTTYQRFRASISSTLNCLISVCPQMTQNIIQKKLSLGEPIINLKKREIEVQKRYDVLDGKIKLIQASIDKYIPIITSNLFDNYKNYLIKLEKNWLEDCQKIEKFAHLNFDELPMLIFENYQKKLISKKINAGVTKYLERSLIKWSEQLDAVISSELNQWQKEIERYVKEFSLEISMIENIFSQGGSLNVAEKINQNKQDTRTQLIIGLLVSDVSLIAGTLIKNCDWVSYIIENIQQIIVMRGILSLFGGPIEWITLIVTEVGMLQIDKDRKQQKLLKRIGEKVFAQLNDQLLEIEFRIKEVTIQQFKQLSYQITAILQAQIYQLQKEQAAIIALREDKNFSIQQENDRLDKIEQQVFKNFQKILEIASNRNYSLEEVESLLKGKILVSPGRV